MSTIGALALAFGGEVFGVVATCALLAALVASIWTGRRVLTRLPAREAGIHPCGACWQLFHEPHLRPLAKFVAVLGPVTWSARQRRYCPRCARRQEMLVIATGVIIAALAVGALVGR